MKDAPLTSEPAAPDDAHPSLRGLDARVLARLRRAVLCPDRDSAEADIGLVMAAGPSPAELIDHYIPEAARRFGEDWMDDFHSFTEVTIGVARLQGWLRALDPRAQSERPVALDVPEVLMVVPPGNQHTLGAMVAMSQFRRAGAVVKLALGHDMAEIGRLSRGGRYDLVAVSAAGETLEFLHDLVNMIRKAVPPVPHIAIGGPILEYRPDIAEQAGADIVTNDPREALASCGHTVSRVAGAGPRPRTSMRSPPTTATVG